MGKATQISWCDHTYNPWRGCRKVAPECANCYITTTVPFRTYEIVLPERPRVFCLSLGDWLDDENVPFEALDRGGVVGVAEIVDCVAASPSPWLFGPWGWVLRGARRLPFAPCPGALNFFSPVTAVPLIES